MSKLVCHIGKFSRGNVFGLQKHNQRENKNYSNENIDLLQSELNYDLANNNNINYLKKVDEIIQKNRTNSNRAVRKDAVIYSETIVGSDKQFFEKLNWDEQKRFFKESYNYLAAKLGKENIVSAVVHNDEGNPHMHFNFVPVIDGALSAKKLINRNFLREIQEEFPKHLKNKGFDIERGMENSTKKHLEPLEFKKQEIKKDIENAKRQQERVKNTSDALSKLEEHTKGVIHRLDSIQAEKPKIPFFKGLSISEEDYSALRSLAKIGESKSLENLQLKAKVGSLESKVDDLKNQLNKFERLKDIDYDYKILKKNTDKLINNYKRIEKAVDNLGLTNEVNREIKSITIKQSRGIDR